MENSPKETPQIVRDIPPDTPESWVFLCRSKDLPKGKLRPYRLMDRDLVVYRTESGTPVAQHRYCAHMGSDLTKGTGRGECIQCPFHAWEFNQEGACTRVPGSKKIPPFARIASYPVEEKNGLLFIYSGKEIAFPVPDLDPTLVAAKPIRLEVDAAWHLIGANAFDVAHLHHVHGRQPLVEPKIEHPHPFAAQIVHQYRISGVLWQDRVIQKVYGEKGSLDFTSWGGTLCLATTTFGSMKNQMLISSQPTSKNRSVTDILVLGNTPWRLPLRRFFTRLFFKQEADSLKNIRYNPKTLAEPDQILAQYMTWLSSL